jgi:hypothetical protein
LVVTLFNPEALFDSFSAEDAQQLLQIFQILDEKLVMIN